MTKKGKEIESLSIKRDRKDNSDIDNCNKERDKNRSNGINKKDRERITSNNRPKEGTKRATDTSTTTNNSINYTTGRNATGV